MDENAAHPAPPVSYVPARSGCLKWTCGCMAATALFCVVAVFVGVYALSGWTRGLSVWENLPPDTVFALEAHDVASLLKTAGNDAGALSLAGAVLGSFQTYLEAGGVPVEEELPVAVYRWSQGLSWIYTTLFPNYALLGMRGFAPEEDIFLIVQQPRWCAWTAGAAVPEGVIEEIVNDNGSRVFITFKGDFAVTALSRETVRHVLDSWGAQAAPLGRRAGRDDAFCMFAARPGDDAPVRPEPAGQGGQDFLSGDPFALPVEARADAVRFQALLSADESGWNITFEAADAAKPVPPAGFARYTDAAFGAATPEVVLPDASDIEVALRMPVESVARINKSLENIPPEFGGEWLRRGVLDRAGGMFTLLASRPVHEDEEAAESGEEQLFPPLPVAGLGWNLSSLQAPAPFANYLERWMGMLPEGAARSLVHVDVSEDRLSGALSLPPVLVNGARPSWKFMTETIPSMGWMATDPAGLPAENLLPRLALHTLAEPAAGHAVVAANWDMSRVFIDAAAAVASDRLSQLPDEWFETLPMKKADFERFISAAAQILTAYPGGAVRADVDIDAREAIGKARIPFGMGVNIE